MGAGAPIHLHTAFFLLASLGLGLSPARGDSPNLSLETFVKAALPAFEKSPSAISLNETIESNQLTYSGALEQSPFSNRTDLSYSLFQSDQNPTDLFLFGRRVNSWLLTQSLNYELRSSLAVQLSITYDYDHYQQPWYYDQLDRPYQALLRFSYDVLQGGSESLANSTAYASASQAKQTLYSNYDGLISARVQYVGVLTDLFVTECKIFGLKHARETVSQALKIGNLQMKTKTIGHKDYLNFVSLENSFAQQLASFELTRDQLFDQLSAWGADAVGLSRDLHKKSFDCVPDLDALFREIDQTRISRQELSAIAQSVPSSRSATAALSASKYQLQAAHLTNLPSLQPYVAGGYNQISHSDQPFTQGTVGITFQWTPPFMKGVDAEAAARKALTAAEDQEKATILNNNALLSSLQDQIVSQRNILSVLDKGAQNSKELLHTLEALRVIGQIDSLNYANAYIDRIDTSNAMLDSWGTLEKSLFQLSEYEGWKTRGRVE